MISKRIAGKTVISYDTRSDYSGTKISFGTNGLHDNDMDQVTFVNINFGKTDSMSITPSYKSVEDYEIGDVSGITIVANGQKAYQDILNILNKMSSLLPDICKTCMELIDDSKSPEVNETSEKPSV